MESVLARVRPLNADSAEAWRYRGQVSLALGGFGDDPRELVDVPEVRTLLRRLEARWDEWAYFLNQVDDSIKLLVSCTAGIEFPGGGVVEMNPIRIVEVLRHAFAGMNEVFTKFGFPGNDLEIASQGLVESFDQAGIT